MTSEKVGVLTRLALLARGECDRPVWPCWLVWPHALVGVTDPFGLLGRGDVAKFGGDFLDDAVVIQWRAHGLGSICQLVHLDQV